MPSTPNTRKKSKKCCKTKGNSTLLAWEISHKKASMFCNIEQALFFDRKMRPRPRLLVPTLTYLSHAKLCASCKICSVAPLPTKGLPFAGSLNTQRPCFRVSSSCTLYEVFRNFAWRSAPPRKRVTQSEKAPDCETESVPAHKAAWHGIGIF